MKRSSLIILFLLLIFVYLAGQPDDRVAAENARQTAPTSKIIDAKRLLTDLQTLSADDMQGRRVGTPGSTKAREYIIKRFKESGIKTFGDSYLQSFEFGDEDGQKAQGTNVFGFIKGRKVPDKYIVVTAHYDHEGVKKGEIYNGADDNASGTVALFAIADYFRKNPPANSIMFVAFDAEEEGLQGSRSFVANLPVKKESILVNLNMDMIAHNDVNELYAVGTYAYPSLKPTLEKVAKTAKVKLLFGHEGPNVSPSEDWTNQSDQGPFNKIKIPFIYFGVEDHKDYHRPTDKFVNINQEFFVHAAETVLETTKSFDKDLK